MQPWIMAMFAMATTGSASASASASATEAENSPSSTSLYPQHNLSRGSVANLIRKGRLLEDKGADYIENALREYSMKIVGCKADAKIVDDDNGGVQYGAVIFRLCPSDTCNDSFSDACASGYADFAIGLNTFVYEFLDYQQQNIQWDDQFPPDDLSQCTQYNLEDGAGRSYYVGPTCTDNGLGIKLALYSDSSCFKQASVTFETISNGQSLPFSKGGVVSSYCTHCSNSDQDDDFDQEKGYDQNDDKDDDDYYKDQADENNYGQNDDANNRRSWRRQRRWMEAGDGEMCNTLYEESPYKCETGWGVSHYYYDSATEIYRYGQNELGCKFIHKIEYGQAEFIAELHEVIFVFVLVMISILVVVAYSMWWSRRTYRDRIICSPPIAHIVLFSPFFLLSSLFRTLYSRTCVLARCDGRQSEPSIGGSLRLLF